MNLNFSALTQPVTTEDTTAYKARFSKPRGSLETVAIVMLVTIAVLAGGVILAVVIFNGLFNILTVLVIIAIVILAGASIILTTLNKRRLIRIFKFAQANGAKLLVNDPNSVYPGMIFNQGYERMIKEAIVFADGREIGNYTYVIGSGRNRQTVKWGYMRIKLVRRLPNMVLDAKKNNMFGGLMSNLPSNLAGGQTLKLEGNFNDHFTLYVPEGYERDAYYVFTPDVMAVLIDHGDKFDIEVVDDELVFYSKEKFRLHRQTHLTDALSVLQTVSSEIVSQGDYYADEKVADRSMNIIAEPGRRLKSKIGIVSSIVVAAYTLYLIWNLVRALFSGN